MRDPFEPEHWYHKIRWWCIMHVPSDWARLIKGKGWIRGMTGFMGMSLQNTLLYSVLWTGYSYGEEILPVPRYLNTNETLFAPLPIHLP